LPWILTEATGNLVAANFIGTDNTGTKPLGNAGDGVYIGSGSNTVGVAGATTRNVISANGYAGVEIRSNGNLVVNSYIGTNAAGNAKLGNGLYGVKLGESTGGVSNNTIGGVTGTGPLNLISGNGTGSGVGIGILIAASSTTPSTGNLIEGNYIGTAADGTTGLGNRGDGVSFGAYANNNTVGGGTDNTTMNVIAANGGYGVDLPALTNNNVITNNNIGVDKNKVVLANTEGWLHDLGNGNTTTPNNHNLP
jgi:titin